MRLFGSFEDENLDFIINFCLENYGNYSMFFKKYPLKITKYSTNKYTNLYNLSLKFLNYKKYCYFFPEVYKFTNLIINNILKNNDRILKFY